MLWFNFRIVGTWRGDAHVTCFSVCLLVVFPFSILIFSPVYRWWSTGDVDAFCCAAGAAEVDVVPVAEARWPWGSQHPQPGRSNTCELGLGAGLSQAAPASDRVSAPSPCCLSLVPGPTPDASQHRPLGVSEWVCRELKPQLWALPSAGGLRACSC